MSGLNRSRGSSFGEAEGVRCAAGSAKLASEAIRLVHRRSSNHGHDPSGGHTAASTHARRHAHAQDAATDTGSLRARRAQAGGLPEALARHRHGGGSAQLPAAPGGQRHLADHAERHADGPEVLLRRHAGPRRADGPDAAGEGAAHLACGAQHRGSHAPDRRGTQPQAPGGAVGGLWRRAARQRGHRPEGHRRGQPAHDAAGRTGQGRQGPLRPAQPGAAAAAAHLVARGPCPGQDAARRLAVPGLGTDGPAVDAAAQPRRPSGGLRRRHRQAREPAHAQAQLCHPPAGAQGRHPRDPGAARAQEAGLCPQSANVRSS